MGIFYSKGVLSRLVIFLGGMCLRCNIKNQLVKCKKISVVFNIIVRANAWAKSLYYVDDQQCTILDQISSVAEGLSPLKIRESRPIRNNLV